MNVIGAAVGRAQRSSITGVEDRAPPCRRRAAVSFQDDFNAGCGAATSVTLGFLRPSGLAEALARGFGILMTAPASFVAAAAAVLGRHGVEHSVIAAQPTSSRPPVVCWGLLLGPDGFIIASAFRFEPR